MIAIYAERLKKRGHTVLLIHPPNRPMPFKYRIKSWVSGRGWPRIPLVYPSHLDGLVVPRKVLETWRPIVADDLPDADVVIATWWETAEWVAKLPSTKGAKVYFIQHYEIHEGQPVDRVKDTWRLPMQKIVVARWLSDVAEQSFGDATALVVPNSVDLRQFDAPPRGKQEAPTVGFMYSTETWKGSDIAAAAIEKARERVPTLKAVAFGMMEICPSLPLPANTEYFQLPQQDRLREIYSQCDAWLVPSRSEGFGLPILEAMACRTPVIASPTGAAPELTARGGGRLFKQGDPADAARAIEQLVSLDDQSWRAMSDSAYQTAHGYTWEDAVELFENALHSAVERARRTTGSVHPVESNREDVRC
ncbi:MAG: hypothetical protein AMXMBFR4_12080 [Candidatus Hydrogenedentota bacterium]